MKITSLHLKGCKAIKELNLPEDGLGWNGAFPDIVLLGGPNGGGKTTLLEHIIFRASMLFPPSDNIPIPFRVRYESSKIDFDFANDIPDVGIISVDSHYEEERTGRSNLTGHFGVLRRKCEQADYQGTRVLYYPAESRLLIVPPEEYKATGNLPEQKEFVYCWKPPIKWKESLEALFYAARWEDLNAKEEGVTNQPSKFEAYAQEFSNFPGNAGKKLRWVNGELVVEKQGVRHSLEELSSGEKQLLLLLSDLRWRWRPGSLVLIDEPELHLHTSWQTHLYNRIVEMQREKGGQVFLTTQSRHLFGIAEPRTQVLLGKGDF